MEQKKVLFFMNNLRVSNGVSSYAMNYYRRIVKLGISCDFLLTERVDSPYNDEVEQNGGKIFVAPSIKKHFFKARKFMEELINKGGYDIIHCHMMYLGIPFLHAGKRCNTPVRIVHSHRTQSGENIFKRAVGGALKPFIIRGANKYFACSLLAGKCLFGKKDFTVIYNAVEPESYFFNMEARLKKRIELGLEDKKVIGAVGRIAKQKNPYFIIDIAKAVFKKDKDAVLIWIGTGPLSEKIQSAVKEQRLDDKIIFLGNRSDMCELYQAMDVFLLPSLFEGLPVVGVEAQFADLPCVFSDTITEEVVLNKKACFVPLKKSADEWADTVLKKINGDVRRRYSLDEIPEQYDIDKAAVRLAQLYKGL